MTNDANKKEISHRLFLFNKEMFKFEVPSLTVGTLDTLMVRSRVV